MVLSRIETAVAELKMDWARVDVNGFGEKRVVPCPS
jgi:hypothetical protein